MRNDAGVRGGDRVQVLRYPWMIRIRVIERTFISPILIGVDFCGYGFYSTFYLVERNGSPIIVLGQDVSFLGHALVMGWKEGL